jgi:hypothetical protein
MKALFLGLLPFLFLPTGAEGAFLQLKGAVHVHSRFSTGALSVAELAEQARMEGVDVVILSENLLLRFEYGLFPFRSLLRKRVEESSVLRQGIGRWLESIEAASATFPDLILIPGVEVMPYYYWTGSPLWGNLTLRDAQKNLLVVGLGKREDYLRIPAIGNSRAPSPQWPHLLQAVLGLAFAWLGMILVRTGREHRIWLKRRYRISGWLALGLGGLLLLEAFTAPELHPYRGDLGIGPYQQVIDAVEAAGGMVFWSLPEARDFRQQAFGPLGTITIQTDPHPEALLKSQAYTGFGAVYQDNVTITEPGQQWDQVLLDYTEGRRARPAWGIGELGYHGPPKHLGDVLTVFLVPERSSEAVLEALRSGRFYSVKSHLDYRLVLEDFSIGQGGTGEGVPMGGELQADGNAPLAIHLRIDSSDGREATFALRLIRSGKLLRVLEGKTPFAETLKATAPDYGRSEFFRIELTKPHRLLSNPISVRRRA